MPFDWTPVLKEECDKVGIDYFSSPYDFEAIDMLDQYMPAYKIGSGEIDWIEALERMASKGKPVLLATGAATIGEVQRAVHAILAINKELVLMQCNTNYTASLENFKHIHLNVLKTYIASDGDGGLRRRLEAFPVRRSVRFPAGRGKAIGRGGAYIRGTH